MENNLLLKTGIDIPFKEAQLIVHQPTIKEISLIGNDEDIYQIIDFINISKDNFNKRDKTSLESFSDFNIFMTMMHNNDAMNLQKIKQNFESLLYLLFPQSKSITATPNSIIIIDNENEIHVIDENNFENFKEIINEVFNFSQLKGNEKEYNPENEAAARIAEKLKKGRERVAAQKKADGKEIDIFGRYASIISVGLQIDLNIVLNYTIYQLFYLYDRFVKKETYDTHLKAQLAGVTGMKEVEHWMQ